MTWVVDDTEENDIENTILDEVEAQTGLSFDDDEEIQKPEQDEQPEPKEEEPPAEQAAPQAARPQQDNRRDRSVNPEMQRWINARRHTDYDYNDKGDVVDKRSGEVRFAKGSIEREFFSALKNEQFERSKVIGQAQQLYSAYEQQGKQLEAYTAAFKAASDSGLNPNDQALAMQMMVAYRANPVQSLRKMLHDYQVEGGDLTEIFDDLPKIQLEGIEGRLKQYADKIERPDREKEAAEQEVARINGEIATLFRQNPEAQLHGDTLAYIINDSKQKGNPVSLSEAWTRLLRFCNANGLRIDQPLQDQLRDPPAPQQQERRQAPMPSRGRSNGVVPRQQNGKPSYERRNRDIVEEAMAEAGFIND